jgi:RNA polymerase sigma-B factor
VDRDTADRLRIGLRHAMSGDGVSAVTVDLTAVPLVDAAGVAVLVEAVQSAAAAGVEFGVTGAQPYVARILAVSGLAGALRRT